jgi:tripartite motif-containing protein 35
MVDEAQAQTFLDTCAAHGDLVDMYCVDCQEKICLICGQREHSRHDWNRTTKVLDRLKSELKEQCNVVVKERVPVLQTEIQKVKTLKDENEKLTDAEMEKIRIQTDYVVNNIQRISNELLNYCKSIRAQNEEKLDGKQKEIETYLTQLEASLQDIQDRSSTTDLSKLLLLKKTVESVPDKFQVSEQDLSLHQINFMEGKESNDILQPALGEIFLTYSQVTVRKIFEAKKGTNVIKYISPISSTQVWI